MTYSHGRRVFVAACLIPLAAPLRAQTADTARTVRLQGFVDAYYAYDVAQPFDGERRFTTQAVRHDEFNVNLAWIGVTMERRRTRARLALQAGTSVQANYAGEPRNGATSGPDLARSIQEAYAGVKLRDGLWLDGGIYYSYIGLEGWSSADNPTYTRSLVAEYTPYYLSGARLTWSATPKLTAQLHVTNGWQNIAENNRSKAVGGRVDYAVSPALTLSYANFFGNEQPTAQPAHLRVFNQVMAKGSIGSGTQWQAQTDLGRQNGSQWYGLVGIVRQAVTPRLAVVARGERYSDPDEIIISTGNAGGFVGNGASLGVDLLIDTDVRWRTEIRGTRTTLPLYPARAAHPATASNTLLVTSLSVAF